MSTALYDLESLRFYSEDEIEMREMMTARFAAVVRRALQGINPGWSFRRVEGPILTPRNVVGTLADYRSIVLHDIKLEMLRFFPSNMIRVVDSDRLPSYSESTIDIEVKHGDEWREAASCSIRTDFHPDCLVFELAIGLDRLVEIYTHWNEEFPR